MKQRTRFKNFGNIGISPWMADISLSVSAKKKTYDIWVDLKLSPKLPNHLWSFRKSKTTSNFFFAETFVIFCWQIFITETFQSFISQLY